MDVSLSTPTMTQVPAIAHRIAKEVKDAIKNQTSNFEPSGFFSFQDDWKSSCKNGIWKVRKIKMILILAGDRSTAFVAVVKWSADNTNNWLNVIPKSPKPNRIA